MKKLCVGLISFLFFLTSCVSNYTEGWVIKNKSNQQVNIYFDKSLITVEADSISFFDNISENATITIADSYHVNYETSYYYRVSEGKHASKLLTITDKTKYEYKIFNNNTYDIKFQIDNEIKEIKTGDSLDLTVYDKPIEFHFMYESFEIPYTENIKDGIRYIYISSETPSQS